jgi:hypothetical protein
MIRIAVVVLRIVVVVDNNKLEQAKKFEGKIKFTIELRALCAAAAAAVDVNIHSVYVLYFFLNLIFDVKNWLSLSRAIYILCKDKSSQRWRQRVNERERARERAQAEWENFSYLTRVLSPASSPF